MFLFLGPEFACSKNRVLRGLLFYYSEYICWTEYSQRYSPRPIHHYGTAHENMGMSPLVSSQSGGARGQESACQCRGRQRCRFDPWVRKIPWSRTWQCTPIFFPGKFNGQRSLAGYIHVVSKNRTQLSRQHTHTHTHTHTQCNLPCPTLLSKQWESSSCYISLSSYLTHSLHYCFSVFTHILNYLKEKKEILIESHRFI